MAGHRDERSVAGRRLAGPATYPSRRRTGGMPIDAETFDRGDPSDSIESRILEHLYGHPETAYTSREIATEVMDEGVSVARADQPADDEAFALEFFDVAAVTSILDQPVDDPPVERRVVSVGSVSRSYYRAPDTVDASSE